MKTIATMLAALLATTPALAEAPAPLTRAVQQGADAGFKDCAPALDKFIRFVHEDDSVYAMYGRWSKSNPNGSMFTTLTSEGSGADTILTSFSAVKNSAGTCDIVMTEIVTTQVTCTKFHEDSLKDWKFFGDLNGSGIYSDPTTENDSVILTNLPGNGCLLTKQLLGYGL